jgi:hypothetical protein
MSTKNLKLSGIVVVCGLLFSFATPRPGGEGFEIFLNSKVVLQQFGDNMKEVKTLKLDQSNLDDELSIRYYHCGRVGKNRTITLKDAKENVLKEWKFTDVKQASAMMTCKVKDILALQKGTDKTVKLYYASSELPKGRQLAALSTGTKAVAKL